MASHAYDEPRHARPDTGHPHPDAGRTTQPMVRTRIPPMDQRRAEAGENGGRDALGWGVAFIGALSILLILGYAGFLVIAQAGT